MPKVIDESKLNYNKYPGEHVIASGGVVQVGARTFHIVQNYREAFDAEKMEQRFSDVLDKYDYIVGDFGFEQLRLKGFFSTSRRKMPADNKIDHLEDYINEYCNYGCPYFVLRRIRTRDVKSEEAFVSEKLFTEKELKQNLDKPRRKRNRNRNRGRVRTDEEKQTQQVAPEKSTAGRKNFQTREKATEKKPYSKDKKANKDPRSTENRDQKFTITDRNVRKTAPETKSKGQTKVGFVIRTRGKD